MKGQRGLTAFKRGLSPSAGDTFGTHLRLNLTCLFCCSGRSGLTVGWFREWSDAPFMTAPSLTSSLPMPPSRRAELIQQAVTADKDKRFEDAYALYRQGLEYMFLALQYEKNQTIKQTLENVVRGFFPGVPLSLPSAGRCLGTLQAAPHGALTPTEQIREHLNRAEQINEYLAKVNQRGPQGGGGETGTSQKPRQGGGRACLARQGEREAPRPSFPEKQVGGKRR